MCGRPSGDYLTSPRPSGRALRTPRRRGAYQGWDGHLGAGAPSVRFDRDPARHLSSRRCRAVDPQSVWVVVGRHAPRPSGGGRPRRSRAGPGGSARLLASRVLGRRRPGCRLSRPARAPARPGWRPPTPVPPVLNAPSAEPVRKAGPAMSRWAHGVPASTNSRRNAAATSAPPARSVPDRAEVGDGGVELAARLRRDRQLPERLARPAAAASSTRCAVASSVAITPGGPVAQRHDRGAGQRGHVDDEVGGVGVAAGQRVGHDQAALGVGVAVLDRRAAVDGQHVGGPVGRAGRHVLGQRRRTR